MGTDYGEIEREICRIPEVSAARIVTGVEGLPVEVHILASPTKQAKQVVRDVQSVALAAFGVELDRRVISVVQLEGSNLLLTSSPEVPTSPTETEPPAVAAVVDAPAPPTQTTPATPVVPPAPAVRPGPPSRSRVPASVVAPVTPAVAPPPATRRPAPTGPARVSLGAVHTRRLGGRRCRAEVSLCLDSSEITGSAEGLYTESAVLRLVALATIAGFRQLDDEADRADVDGVVVVQVGGRQVAIVAVVLVDAPGEEVCTGSAPVRVAGAIDGVARATLDALNRRLGRAR